MSAGIANAALVAQWKFDETSGTTAQDSAGSKTGTLINGAGWTGGVSGNALNLDGVNDYVTVADNPSLDFTQSSSFTISFWINQTTGGEVLSKMQTDSRLGLFCYEVQNYNNTIRFVAESSGLDETIVSAPNNSFAAGQWYHVATVYDNRNMKIYLNGALSASGTFTGSASGLSDKDMAIGVRSFSSYMYSYLGGSLDDLRIYNEALNAGTISDIYHTTPEPATLLLLGLGGMLIRKRSQASKN